MHKAEGSHSIVFFSLIRKKYIEIECYGDQQSNSKVDKNDKEIITSLPKPTFGFKGPGEKL